HPEPIDPGSGPAAAPSGSEDRRLWVADGGERRPFMRGIMIHSLMARGVAFDGANRRAATGCAAPPPRPRCWAEKPAIREILLELLDPSLFEAENRLPLAAEITVKGKGRGQPF